MTGIAFLDTETTSLRHDRRAWEIAVIVRREGHPDHEQTWLIDAGDLDLGKADPASLDISGFWERHPYGRKTTHAVESEIWALKAVADLTAGMVIHGSNPSFDMELLAARMRARGLGEPRWHYHPVDVPTLAHGWLLGAGKKVPRRPDGRVKSDDLSRACGVDPDRYGRHTALGDCRWLRDLHRAVAGTSTALPASRQRVYHYVRDHLAEHGRAPSIREIGAAVYLQPSSVAYQLGRLEEAGLIRRDPTKPRAIALTTQEES